MSWAGGRFGSGAECVLAPNANMMTLDGTNTWVLRDPGSDRSVVVDPGPLDAGHLDAVAEAPTEQLGDRLAQQLAGDVPERDIHRREGERAPEQHPLQLANERTVAERVLADEQRPNPLLD